MAHSSARCHYLCQAWFGRRTGASSCDSSRPRACRPGNINYDLHRSNDDPDVWILYENWKAPSDLAAHFEIALHEGIPSGAARGARKRNGFAALFDGYEDCIKV